MLLEFNNIFKFLQKIQNVKQNSNNKTSDQLLFDISDNTTIIKYISHLIQ